LARRKERQAAAIHSTIALDQQFEHELEVFRTESETAAQFFYAFLAIHASAGPDKSVHRLLNTAPLFWNTVLGGLQAAAFVAMGRVFDQKSTHNVDRLLKLAQDNPQIFSKAALARRQQGTASAPQSKGAWQQAAEADRLVEGDEAGRRPRVQCIDGPAVARPDREHIGRASALPRYGSTIEMALDD
jgi:AbiU2